MRAFRVSNLPGLRAFMCITLMPVPALAVVNIGPTCGETSIQHAIDTYTEETDFYVDVGTYAENLYLNSPFETRYLRILGGHINCSDQVLDDPTATVLTGAGSNQSVIAITGAINAYIGGLTITGGSAPVGGGIFFNGTGGLALVDARITANAAQSGGGIGVVPHKGPVDVGLLRNTLISGNTASTAGGGVYVSGDASFRVGMSSAIAYNTVSGASGVGGGLAIVGSARADIASQGFFDPLFNLTYGAIAYNKATFGAGARASDGAVVRVYSVEEGRPTVIENNGDLDGPHETLYGGGIEATSGAKVCGWGYTFSNNRAGAGAAIRSYGAQVQLSRDAIFDACGSPSSPPLYLAECAPGDTCNRFQLNVGESDIINTSSGVGFPSVFQADRVEMSQNTVLAAGLIDSYNDSSLTNCLITGNLTRYVVIWRQQLSLDGCTIAGNQSEDPQFDTRIFTADPSLPGGLTLSRSIVWQPEAIMVQNTLSSVTVNDVITSDAAALSAGIHSGITQADPLFIDSANADYRPRPASPAVDYAITGPLATDIAGQARGVQIRSAAHPHDVGAYELQDPIFANGFQ